MGNAITGKEYPLVKIFSSDFEYHIPAYQRPYAWTKTETEELFDDLYDFYKTEPHDSFFLGSIVLIKDESKPYADVIDGQQRLTTLSILFAVMTDLFQTLSVKDNCMEYLQEKGNELAGIPAQPRLFLREKDQPFFNRYIQHIRLDDLLKQDPKSFNDEAQVNIQENCRVLRERFQDMFPSEKELIEFSKFLLTRCFLIAVSTANQDSAFRIFSVMNSRGLDLLPTDIIKSETIGKLPVGIQDEYTKKWEDLEAMTNRDGFNEVFTHIRTIFVKERRKKNLLDEFRESVMSRVTPQSLIDDYLDPYARAYVQLKNSSFSSTHYADEINRLLRWLNKTNNYDWMPPAIKFLAEHKNDSAYVLWFVRKLERLASYLFVTACDVNWRTARYKWVLVEMESRPDNSLANPLRNVELTEWEKDEFVTALDGDIYMMPSQRRNYVIQRLDDFCSDRGALYDDQLFTIEHVLPQNPAEDSEWTRQWTGDQRKLWLNRIANLVPLTRQRNSSAQNFNFTRKKKEYFQSKNGTSSYSLTTQVLSVDQWTPKIVEKRQRELLNQFIEKWDLKEDKNAADDTDFMVAGRGGDAVGYLQDNGNFVVKKGSRIAATTTLGSPKNYIDLRDELLKEGVISENQFVQDYIFESPSAAAAIVLGRSSNGRKEWTKLDGRSIMKMGK